MVLRNFEPEEIAVEVEVPAASLEVLDRAAMADLFASFAMHVLFMRAQIPVPFPQLQAEAQAQAE